MKTIRMLNKQEVKIKKVVETLVQEANEDIASFAKDLLEKEHPSYTLEWQTQGVLFQSKMLQIAGGVLNAINNPNHPKSITEIAEWRIQESERHLLGNDLISGEGPWKPNSTSPVANLLHIEEANAHRILRAKLKEALL